MKRTCVLTLVSCICVISTAIPAVAEALPARFSDTVAFSGLSSPTSVDFAPDGRIFVAEQSGLIKVYDGLSDTTPTQFADLRTKTHSFWDRGLLSMVLDPDFPDRPYVYVSYTYDAEIGGTAPRWGTAGQSADPCPSPPGATADGCVVSGRLSRLTANGDAMSAESVLINDWCQQYPSHSIGDIGFGADGNLYMTGGDGASFGFDDYGQDGNPLNPCGDPPSGVGGVQTVPTAEGGTLRSQDIRTSGDPLGLDGTLIRVDPDTGRPVPDLPGETNKSTLNEARIVAYGFRNPFRFAIRPGTNEVWIGDVGWGRTEEINRVVPGTTGNYGWPCFEGTVRLYENLGLNLCNSLYAAGGQRPPYFSFVHGVKVDPNETCLINNGSSISGMEFYETGPGPASFPASYDGALFFADYARNCIWVMATGSNGLPDPSQVSVFETVTGPVELEVGPDGALYYASLSTGTIHRIVYEPENRAPIARAVASPDHGPAPLDVHLSATTSSDPDPGDQLSFAWDLDEDGSFDDSSSAEVDRVYGDEGVYNPRVRVTDPDGASAIDEVEVDVGVPPVPAIGAPRVGVAFTANQTIRFSGSAMDARDGAIPAADLDWTAVLNHCTDDGGCHEHGLQEFEGVSGGSLAMPSHERPYFMTLTLTAGDSDGLQASKSIDIHPRPNAAPAPRIITPSAEAGFTAGQRISFTGEAVDPEDGELTASALSWRLVGVDCPTEDCMDQPLTTLAGDDHGEFVAPSGPIPYPLRLELTATDLEGRTAKTSMLLEPRVASLRIESNREGARVSIEGRRGEAPTSLTVLQGAAVRIAAPARQHAPGYGGRAKWKWRRWSDGGDRIHTVSLSRDRTYRAIFRLRPKPRDRR